MGKLFTWIVAFIFLCVIIGFLGGMCNNTAKTITEQFSPGALLKKYETFKDQSAAIDKADANIRIQQEDLADLIKNSDSSKEDKFYIQQRRQELIGAISIRNGVAADYNAAMSKFNYRFTNQGDLPAGASVVLPREVKPYLTTTK